MNLSSVKTQYKSLHFQTQPKSTKESLKSRSKVYFCKNILVNKGLYDLWLLNKNNGKEESFSHTKFIIKSSHIFIVVLMVLLALIKMVNFNILEQYQETLNKMLFIIIVTVRTYIFL